MPEVEIRSVDPEPRVDGRVLDLAVLGEVKGRPVRFLVEAKASGYPRDVQQAIWQLDGLRRLEQPVADVPLLAAPAISEAGRELVTESYRVTRPISRIGWLIIGTMAATNDRRAQLRAGMEQTLQRIRATVEQHVPVAWPPDPSPSPPSSGGWTRSASASGPRGNTSGRLPMSPGEAIPGPRAVWPRDRSGAAMAKLAARLKTEEEL